MSVFASLCHDKKHIDQVDVAYSIADPKVRLVIWKDEDGNEASAYLSVDEAQHIIDLMQQAIKNTTRWLK